MKHSLDRQKKVISEMNKTNLRWCFLEAVDGTQIDTKKIPYIPQKVNQLLGFELTPKELGCYLSHFEAWKACVHENLPTLIFEDDFVVGDNFEESLSILLSNPDDWDLVRLQALWNSADVPIREYGSINLVRNLGDPLGATAYLLNPLAAEKLIAHSSEIYEPVDHFIEHVEKHGLQILAVKPYPITVSDPTRATSTITDRPERAPIRGLAKFKRSIYRLIDRTFSDNPYFPK